MQNERPPYLTLLVNALLIGSVAYAVIIGLVLAVPHLPLANKRTFYALLRAQMAVDEGEKLPAQRREMVLFLGSSVVERGVSERAMDTVFAQQDAPLVTMNAGTGGFCAEANLPMFRAMLDDGLRPAYVVYGVGIQELNAESSVHAFLAANDTSAVKLRRKSFLNVIRYGPTALAPLINADHLHQYLFAANNAFRDVPNLNVFQRVMFGENMPPQDSTYRFEQRYLSDMREIANLCIEHNIKVALYNAPMKPRDLDKQDEPYRHRGEAYQRILALAQGLHIPIWNFDRAGLFALSDFQDNYHLTPSGAKNISAMLGDSIVRWRAGAITQDQAMPN